MFGNGFPVEMNQAPNQQTLAHVTHVSGRGYWSGQKITLTFLPAEAGVGIRFRRVDLPGKPEIPALASYRSDAVLRTKLVHQGASVEMVEHVLAALYGMGIDNCIVECDAAEMPGLDGSAYAIALALFQAGTRRIDAPCVVHRIERESRIGDDRAHVQISPSEQSGQSGLTLMYHLDYGKHSPIPSTSSTYLLSPDEFLHSIAPARTFLTIEDAEHLQRSGVAQHVTTRDLLIFGEFGPIQNQMRFPDECSRHKLLDLIGDLALCGMRIEGNVFAHRSGHQLNGRMAEFLMRSQLLATPRTFPGADPSNAPQNPFENTAQRVA